ncbi:unnamed protein product [Cylicocyclus nassatus]|uniref:Uncharacterized protein n=1 Tax=Cylicocyclus nassatus TaxID=53992 RepID=A0AA36DQY5_CYLNA|nr:unnamed protein product [Cylicocyclus nassatus]
MQIADFAEPIAVPGGQMKQGSYQLKSDVRVNVLPSTMSASRAFTEVQCYHPDECREDGIEDLRFEKLPLN